LVLITTDNATRIGEQRLSYFADDTWARRHVVGTVCDQMPGGVCSFGQRKIHPIYGCQPLPGRMLSGNWARGVANRASVVRELHETIRMLYQFDIKNAAADKRATNPANMMKRMPLSSTIDGCDCCG
jgi:hypothetical protein